MSSDGKRHSGRCYVCHEQADDLVWDEDLESLRHEGCSLSSVAARLPVTIRDLKIGIARAEDAVLNPELTYPYRGAWTTLRRSARRALEDLQRLEIPPLFSFDQVIGEIVAEGHARVRLDYAGWRSENERWECETYLDVGSKPKDESAVAYFFRAHDGEAQGATALEAANRRLEQIRAGKGLAVLFSFFLPIEGTRQDRQACITPNEPPDNIVDLGQIEEA